MSSRSNFRLLPLLLALFTGPAVAEDWQSLLENSPFGQPAASPEVGMVGGSIEFRGVVHEEGVVLVNLYDPTTKTAQWIEVSGQAPGLEVQAYDAVAHKVQINQAGRSLTLPLKRAAVALVAMPVAAEMPDPVAQGEGPPVPGDRRAQIREMIRNRMENNPPGSPAGSPAGGPGQAVRNLPPEAQEMIQEFRRRRAERAANRPNFPVPVESNRREQP